MKWSTETAQQCAAEGRIEEWIHAYLNAGEWANRGLSEGLKKAPRWWAGPVLVPLGEMARTCGPESWMPYQVTSDHWETKTQQIASQLDDPMQVPPVILEDIAGQLRVCDGNHRHEAAQKKNWQSMWAVIWFNSEAEWKASWFYTKETSQDNDRSLQR